MQNRKFDRSRRLLKNIIEVRNIPALRLVLALSFVLFVLGIWWGLPDYRGWAPDEVVPTRVIDGLRQFYSNGWYDKYPPFHYYLLSLIYSPFLLLHRLHILDLRQLSSYAILFYLGRSLSVFMGTAVVYLVYRCGREIFDRRASVFAALITALIVPFEYYSKTVNLDVPYIFWFVGSLYFFIRLLKTQRLKYYLLFATAAVTAVCTKDQAYSLYVLAPLPIVFVNWRHERQSNPKLSLARSLVDRRYLYSLLAGAGLFFLLHNIAFNLQGFLRHLNLIEGSASQSYKIYASSFLGQAQLLGVTVREIQGSLGWPLFLLCSGGLILSLGQRKKNPLLLSLSVFAVSYYVFYIARILFNVDRYNLPICIILSFFGGSLISGLLNPGAKFLKAKAALVAVIFGFNFFYSLSVDVLMIADSRYAVERWIKQNVPKEAVIGIAGPGEYCPRLLGFQVREIPLSETAFQKAQKPDFVIIPTAFKRAFAEGSEAHKFFLAFSKAGGGYRLVLRHQTVLPWLVIRYQNIGTNMIAVNPEIEVYRRVGFNKDRPL
jgi:hypothetical protein